MKTPEEIKKGLECCMHEGECKRCPYQGKKCTITASGDALAYIQQLEAAQPKWISVEERLPSDHEMVLVAIKEHDGYKIYTARHSSWRDIWYIGDMCGVGGNPPTHWMPLPEPPKGV